MKHWLLIKLKIIELTLEEMYTNKTKLFCRLDRAYHLI